MNRQNWTLIATKFAGPAGLTPVQLQKALFLLGKEMPTAVPADHYRFVPHNFGPFSKDIYSDAESLSSEGLVAISERGKYPEYVCTSAGKMAAEMVEVGFDPDALEYLKRVVEWVQGQTFSSLVRSIYAKYPEYRVNSVFSE